MRWELASPSPDTSTPKLPVSLVGTAGVASAGAVATVFVMNVYLPAAIGGMGTTSLPA